MSRLQEQKNFVKDIHRPLSSQSHTIEQYHQRTKNILRVGTAKVCTGLLLLVFGLVSLSVDAALASLASGLWAGGLGTANGLAAVVIAKCKRHSGHLVLFLSLSIISAITGGLAAAFTAAGISHDIQLVNPAYYVNSEGQRVLIYGGLSAQAPLLVTAAVTLASAIVDCILAVICCVLGAREACQCYLRNVDEEDDSRTRHDRLVTWLGQQALLDFLMASDKKCTLGSNNNAAKK